MTSRFTRLPASGQRFEVLIPSDADPPDPAKFLNQSGEYVVPTPAITPSPYSVGPAGIGSYQTIQSAIDAAQLAGANYNAPAVIDILGGRWTENLVVSCGGLTFRAVNPQIGSILIGTVDCTLKPTENNTLGFDGFRVTGLVTVKGSTTGSFRWWSQFGYFSAGMLVETATNMQFYDRFGYYSKAVGDVVAAPGMSYFDAIGSSFFANSRNSLAIHARSSGAGNSTNLKGVSIFGYCEISGVNSQFVGGKIDGGTGPALLSHISGECDFMGVNVECSGGGNLVDHDGAGVFNYAGINWVGGTGAIKNLGAGSLVAGATTP